MPTAIAAGINYCASMTHDFNNNRLYGINPLLPQPCE